MEQPNQSGISRRDFLKEVAAAGALGSGTGWLLHELRESKPGRHEHLEQGGPFEKEVAGYAAFVGLNHNQVLFVDADNVPVGPPVEFEDIIAPKELPDGSVIEEYLYSAGPVGEDGVLLNPPTLEWRRLVEERVQQTYPDRKITGDYNVVKIFNAAAHYDDEPALQAGIRDGSIRSYGDIVNYFAAITVHGDEKERSRYEYIQNAIELNTEIPAVVRAALQKLVPGICAQESKFNNGLVNPTSGAFGIMQFMPWIWKHYGKSPHDIKSFKVQVEVAGLLISDMYQQFIDLCASDALLTARAHFSSQEEFLIDFVTPMVVNSYNAGPARMADVMNAYFATHGTDATMQGKALFQAVADFGKAGSAGRLADYDEHAREYVPRVYAHSVALMLP